MAVATHLGPWLLGTVKDTTGTTAGTIRNVGATHSFQSKAVVYTDTTANTTLAVLPAGAMIQQVQFLTTTAYGTATPAFTIYVNGTAVSASVSTTAFGSTGRANIALATTNPGLVANVGTTDAIISFTQAAGSSTAGAGQLEISYIVRNADGTYGATN